MAADPAACAADPDAVDFGTPVGETTAEYALSFGGETVALPPLEALYEGKLAPVYPYFDENPQIEVAGTTEVASPATSPKPEGYSHRPTLLTHKPVAFIPAFPGTNCEEDTARALRRAGAEPRILILNNLTPSAIAESLQTAARMIAESHMIVFPGGFSGGDEPDGSGKFINAFFRNPAMADAVHGLLRQREGLILGICNGFQALIKLGLLPYGEITDITPQSPTLTFNAIGRHQSMLVRTRIASNRSPWLQKTEVGEIHTVAISHGEGRFVGDEQVLAALARSGQIATQYVDFSGQPTSDPRHNPNGSRWAIEGITSPDGRILGKMGHTERAGRDLYKNVEGNKFQPLFEGGVAYFQ
jgi:phosphoribosylformylglycinamidine synthase